MNELFNFPDISNGLKVVGFSGSDDEDEIYTDGTLNRIMDWLILSSVNTLEEITIANMNQVTRVPCQLSSFKSLEKLQLYNNNINIINTGAFSFASPISLLILYVNGIKEIEQGAFQGYFHPNRYFTMSMG